MNRLELGGNLQGVDYTYTLHGQLKAINNSINDKDPGKDGSNGFAADVFGLQLDYNEVDYQNSGVTHNFQIGGYRPHKNAYDGRINSLRWGRPNIQPYYEYEYQPATGWLSAARYGRVVGGQKISSEAYAVENLTYDENGNILTLKRRGTSEAPDMDKLAYTYEAESNQLAYVADEVAPGAYPHDLDGQQPNNYEYNKIGQLIFNKQDDVGYAYYTSGLTKAIYNGRVESGTKRVEFQYNESGHRIKKLSYNANGQLLKTTFYVRDAAGTPIAIYYQDEGNTDKSIILAEQVVYGSSRLGTLNRTTETMLYEITDHLGNVRAVVAKGENNQPIAVLGTVDYYPGGMEFPDENSLDYRYGYQGEYAEKDEETGLNAFELRMYDPRINRWITPDPKRQYASPYMAMGNNWASRVDPDGGMDCDNCPENGVDGDLFKDGGQEYIRDNGSWNMIGGELDEVVATPSTAMYKAGDPNMGSSLSSLSMNMASTFQAYKGVWTPKMQKGLVDIWRNNIVFEASGKFNAGSYFDVGLKKGASVNYGVRSTVADIGIKKDRGTTEFEGFRNYYKYKKDERVELGVAYGVGTNIVYTRGNIKDFSVGAMIYSYHHYSNGSNFLGIEIAPSVGVLLGIEGTAKIGIEW